MVRKTIRLSCTVPAMVGVYVDELLARGTFGNSRAEVVNRLICNGCMEALSGDTIRRLVEQHAPKPEAAS
jgi:hypothetical protein